MREKGKTTWCLFDLSTQFPQLVEWMRSVASVKFLRGVSLGVIVGFDFLSFQHESSLDFLQAVQLENTILVLLHCSS